MQRTTRPVLALLVAWAALAVTSPGPDAADWARWLGPTQDGRVAGLGLAPGAQVELGRIWPGTTCKRDYRIVEADYPQG